MLLLYDIYLGILKNITLFYMSSQMKSEFHEPAGELSPYASVLRENVKYFIGFPIVSLT